MTRAAVPSLFSRPQNVRMIEPGEHFGFALETSQPVATASGNT